MKIGVIYLGRRGAGGPLSCLLSKSLHRYANVFSIISLNSESLPAWEASGIEHISIQTYTNIKEAVFSWINRKKFQELADLIRSMKPDILIYPMFYTWNPLIQREMRDIPAIVAVHDPIPHPGLQNNAFRILEDVSIHMAKRCLVFSQELVGPLEKRGVPKESIDVIPLGSLNTQTHLSFRQNESINSSIRDDNKTLLFFGRITAYKGLDILLKAYRQISDKYDLRLIIVGDGNILPYHPLLEDLSNIEIVNRWVTESEIERFFGQADIVVLPYTSASQSGVIALAASYGLPVIATRTGGIPEQITDGVTGVLITPGSVKELLYAIEKLLDAPERARQLGNKLQQKYQRENNWDWIATLVYESSLRALKDKK